MKLRLLALALLGSLALGAVALAQAPKSGDKGGDKKAPAPKTPGDLAFDEFTKARTGGPGAKMDQARFQKVIASGMSYLTEFPTHNKVNEVIRDLAFFGSNIDRKLTAQRIAFASLLKVDVTNYRYKDGLSEPAKAVIAALDAAVADFDVRESYNGDNLTNVREKIDALAQTPGANRFVLERERSYTHILMFGSNVARAEAHLKKLLEHPDKPIAAMAREELNILEAKKEPSTLKFQALDGKEVDFAQLRGKVVALYFWSTANGASTKNFDQLKQIYSDYRKKNFEVVTVSFDKPEDREKLDKFIKENRIAWPVYFDGKGAKGDFSAKLNATSVPRLYVFDQKGILQTNPQGAPVAMLTPNLPLNQLEGLLKKLLGIK
jgi:peroxiredoxin